MSAAGVRFDGERVRVVCEWPVPGTVREMQSFIGIVTYFARYINDYAEIAAALYEKTSAGLGSTRITLDAFVLKHVDRLTNALAEFPQLSHFWLDEPFTLQTAASKTAIGFVIFQRQLDGLERQIALFSKK